ncbi:MAG: glycoside hydrolase family 28 protein [Bacteroidia bacterium]
MNFATKTITTACFILLFSHSVLLAQDYNILNYGASPDGQTLSTLAIQKAIDEAHADGGGRVLIPAGTFLSGSIVLKSGVDLHLHKKATLLGSLDSKDYIRLNKWTALIMADSAYNIAVTGKGTIDGQGHPLALHIDSLFYAGEIDSSKYVFPEKRPKVTIRPEIIEFADCKYAKVTDVTILNAASWVQTYWSCENLVIDNIRVDSDTYWNNDGIDIIDCRNVRITNCYINSSDDGICLKSYRVKNYDKLEVKPMCDSIYIGNCTIRSSASAIKFGTSSLYGFKNVTIEKIKVFDTFRSVIALESYMGSVLENVLIQDVQAVNTGNAIFIRAGERTGYGYGAVRNIVIRNMKVKIASRRPDHAYKIRGPALPFFHNPFPAVIAGIPGNAVQDIRLENIEITYPGGGNNAYANMPLHRIGGIPELPSAYPEFSMFGELPSWGFYIRHVENLNMINVRVKIRKPDYRPAFVLDDVKNSTLTSIQVVGDDKPDPIFLYQTEKIKIVDTD